MATPRALRPRPVPASRQARTPATPEVAVPATLTALRRGRTALDHIDRELDGVLDWLHDPATPLDAGIPDRLASHAREADDALGGLRDFRLQAAHALY